MRTHYILLVAALIALVPMTAPGQITQVYVADGQSCSIVAYAGTVPTIIAPQMFCFIQGMSLAADGQILLADSQQGIARVDPETSETAFLDTTAYSAADVYPDCGSEDIYYVTTYYPGLYVLPGGNGPRELCVGFATPPLDLQVYPFGERAGHVLVLLDGGETTLPYLAEYRRTGPTTFEELAPIVPEATSNAVAFAIRPDGGIVLLDSMAGMYNVGPGGDLTHFGPDGVIGGDIDIDAGGTIYVTNAEAGRTDRFDLAGNRILPSLNGDVELPVAVVAVGFTPTPPGGGVPVTPVEGVELLFERITGGGYTSATTTGSASRVSPAGNTLPDYAVTPGGADFFTYVSLATTAVLENLIQVDVLLPGGRLFYAHGTGQVFHDATVQGSLEDARGVISRFSEVVLVDDVRPVGEVVDDKFGGLFEILQSPPEDPPDLRAAREHLRRHAHAASNFYHVSADPLSAVTELSFMNGDIRNWAGTVIPNSSDSPGGNLAGEMLSRSKTLMFSLWFLVPPSGVPADGSTGADASLSLACESPARGECRMELAGPVGARVTAELCTVGGRLVRTLFDGVLGDGSETLIWDGTDSDGRPAASGVYVARVRSGIALATGKVVFIR
jgi:hypothetical protein